MNDHEHDRWVAPGGRFRCIVCGRIWPAIDLSVVEQATVDRFGIFDEESGDLA